MFMKLTFPLLLYSKIQAELSLDYTLFDCTQSDGSLRSKNKLERTFTMMASSTVKVNEYHYIF